MLAFECLQSIDLNFLTLFAVYVCSARPRGPSHLKTYGLVRSGRTKNHSSRQQSKNIMLQISAYDTFGEIVCLCNRET